MPRTLEDYRKDLGGIDIPEDILKEAIRGFDPSFNTGKAEKSPISGEPVKRPRFPDLAKFRKDLGGIDVPDDVLTEAAQSLYPDRFPAVKPKPQEPITSEPSLFQKTSKLAKTAFETVPRHIQDVGLKAILSLTKSPEVDRSEVPQLASPGEGRNEMKSLMLAGAVQLSGIYKGLTGIDLPLSEETKRSIESNQVNPAIAHASGEIVGGLGLFLGMGKVLQAGKVGETVMQSFARTPELARILGAGARAGAEFGGAGGFKEAIKQVTSGKLDPGEFGKVVLKDTAIGAGFGAVTAGTAGRFQDAIPDALFQTAGASAYGFGVSALEGHDFLTSVISGATAGLYALAGAKNATQAQKLGAFTTAKTNVENAARTEAIKRGYSEDQANTFSAIATEKFTDFVNKIGGEKVAIRNWDKISKDIYKEMNDVFEKGDPIARVPKDILLDVLKSQSTGEPPAGETPKPPTGPQPLRLVPIQEDVTTIDGNLFGGPEAVKTFQLDLPLLADSILGKSFPVAPEEVKAGLQIALNARNAVLHRGGHPDDAQLAALDSFLKIVSPEKIEPKPKESTSTEKPPEQAPAEAIQAAAASLDIKPHELTYDQFKRVFANDIKGMPEEEVRADYRQTIMAAIKEGKDVPESIIQGLQQKVGASDLSPLAGAPATPTIETKPKKVRLDARGIPLLKPNAVVLKLELDNKQTATLTHKVALEHAKSLMKETLDRWEDLKANDLISKIGKIRWTDDLENLGDLSGKVIPGWLRARIFTKDPSSPLLDEKAQDLGISEADLIKQIVDYPKTLKKAPSRNLADYYQEAIHEWEYYTLHPQAHQAMDKSARYDAILGNQRANEGMQAAVKDPKTGELLTGPSHSAIIRDVIKNDLESADRITAEILNQTENVGFVDQDFEFITRQQAERRFGILNSESLPKGGTLRQPAYHGSPYRFDRFSVQKIGTGEGHQTFGWGLYFAGKKDVAEYYRKTLTPDREIPANVRMAFSRLDNLGFDSFFEALSNVEANPKDWKEMWDVDPLRDPKEMMDAHIIDEFIKQPKQKGHVYEVDIPEDGDYLNWDKPLSEQPHVLSALNKLPAEVKALVTKNFASVSNWTGEEFYKGLADAIVPSEDKNFGGHVTDYEGASKQLLNVGIPGLRYLDQGSRITGEGTYNYVLFDDSLVKITKVSESPTLDVSNEVNGEPIGKVRSATEFKRKEVDIAFKQKPPEPGSPDFFIGQPGPREIYQSSFAVKYQKTGSLFIPNQKIYSPQDIAFAFRYLHNEAVENFLIGAVKNGKIVGIEHIATGRIDQVSVDFFDTIHLLDHVEADGYFMVHNHPSGFPEPSLEDIDLTKAARTILDRSGYKLLGHVVIDDTTFGFIDPDLKVRQWKHQEYTKTKEVPLLKKYLEWTRRKVDPRHAPSITSPQAVFEVAKGIQVGMDEGVVFLLNTHNRIINALIVPKSQMNTGDLQRLAGRYRGNRIILANSSIPNFQLPIVQRDLRSAGISLLDDVLSTDAGYRSAVETGILGEEPVKYQTGLELSDQPGTYTAKEKLEDEYAKARNVKDPTIKDTTKQFLDEKKSSIREFGESLGLVISDRLADVDPSLKTALRKFESDYRQAIKRDLERVRPFMRGLDKIAKLNKTDALIMDLAMKNGDAGMQTQMAMKYGILDELMKARVLLEEIRPRIQSVGYQVGYRTGYFPRKIRDRKGFIKYMEKQGELWGEIDQAIREKEESLKRELNEEEKVNLINSFIRGFTRSKVALAHTGNMKTREIEMLTVAINKFYYSGRESLARYISEVNEAIEARKFFGRVEVNPKLDAPSQMVMEEMTPKEKTESALSFNNIQDSIGAFVNRLLEAGKITPTQQEELRDIFQARFGYIGSHGILGLYKNITYMNTITSVISGLSNLDDVGVSLYKATWQTPGSFIRAIANRSKIKLEELGLEAMNEEIREASKSAALLRMMLRPLFTPFDRIGKETTLNAVIDRYRSIAKGGHATFDERFNSLFGAKGDRFEDKLVDIFGAEADNVLEDLKEGRITENILFLAFNELSEIQPISLSEVPQVYLESPGGRLFYTLKTFMVKRLNFLRAEVHNAKDKKEAIIQMMKMLGWMIAAGIGVDELKDFILNRKTSWSDRIIDNVLRPIGISKYLLYRIREDGAQAVLGYFLLPPTPLIDGIWRDIRFAGKPVKTGPNRKEPRMYEFTRSIPMFGKEYYWWFGRGAQKTREQEFKRAQKARKNRL